MNDDTLLNDDSEDKDEDIKEEDTDVSKEDEDLDDLGDGEKEAD